MKQHEDFFQYFYECPEDIPWTECELESDNEETRIPLNVLDTNDAETVFKNYTNMLQQEKQQSEYVEHTLIDCVFVFSVNNPCLLKF